MKYISLLFFTMIGLSAADALTVDPSGKVGIGTATPTSTLDVAGTTTATNVIVNRATQAGATEAVRGDDPRMTNARPANGGNAATVGGMAPSAFVATTAKGVANGVATLDAAGKVPSAQLPSIVGIARGMQTFRTSGSFTVPGGVTKVIVKVWGGGGGGGTGTSGSGGDPFVPGPSGTPGGGGGFAQGAITVTPGQVVSVTVGLGGVGGVGGGAPNSGAI